MCCSVLPPEIIMHDAYIGRRSENNIKRIVHDDLWQKNRTTRYIMPHHWFTSDFLSFIVVEHIRFFHRVLHLVLGSVETSWLNYLIVVCLTINIFAPQRQLLHQFTWNLAQPRGTWVRLALQNFMPIGAQGGNVAPKWQKSPFLERVAPQGRTLWPIFTAVGVFLYAQLLFISVLHLRWFASRNYCWETANHSFTPKFSVHPVWETMRWIEKWFLPFSVVSTSSISTQSLGKIGKCALAVGAKIWCFYVLSVCHALVHRHALRSRGHIWPSIV